MSIINNKYDFVAFFEVINGNPNGDPDTGNMPRVDPETGVGLVTDVCLKRKIRNYVETLKGNEAGYDIYIKSGMPLNAKDARIFNECGIKVEEDCSNIEKVIKDSKNKTEIETNVHDLLCKHYFDIRTFGAVVTSIAKAKMNGGQIRGPVQFGFARSIDPVFPHDITITRCVVNSVEDSKKQTNTMGNKSIISYGLYRVEGYVSANLAKQTGFSEDDLELIWDSILNMFEDDRSAARGNMSTRKLIIFKHESVLGNCPSYKLFEAIKVTHRDGVSLPRSFNDYSIEIDRKAIPSSVTVIEK